MIRFKQFITEEKNTHMMHAEDAVWDLGVDGVRQVINYFRTLRDQLQGSVARPMNLSVKWDGAPAVFAGTDPTDGKFFVAKKGIFNKNPKVYKTNKDIDDDTSGDLNTKLKMALEHLPSLGITGVIQGDFLFAQEDLRTTTINGKSYVTFHPNTIVYAIPADSKLAAQIKRSKIGVVWHTTYRGQSFETMRASFGQEIASKLKSSKNVWSVDAVFKDVSGQANFTKTETAMVTQKLSSAGKNFNKISKNTFDLISKGEVNIRLNTFVNSKIRQGEIVRSPKAFARDLKAYLDAHFSKEEDKRKSDKGKANVRSKKNELISKVESIPQSEFEALINLYNDLLDAKHIIVKKLDKASSINTFLQTSNGFEVTAPEGYVAIDHMGKNAVKLVDRLQFSRANFSSNVKKGWQR